MADSAYLLSLHWAKITIADPKKNFVTFKTIVVKKLARMNNVYPYDSDILLKNLKCSFCGTYYYSQVCHR